MKTLKAALQLPVLLLIFYLGSVNLYGVIQAVPSLRLHPLDWQYLAAVTEGVLEVVLLVWFYRWLGRAASAPQVVSR